MDVLELEQEESEEKTGRHMALSWYIKKIARVEDKISNLTCLRYLVRDKKISKI